MHSMREGLSWLLEMVDRDFLKKVGTRFMRLNTATYN